MNGTETKHRQVRLNKHLTDLEHTFYGSSLAYDLVCFAQIVLCMLRYVPSCLKINLALTPVYHHSITGLQESMDDSLE